MRLMMLAPLFLVSACNGISTTSAALTTDDADLVASLDAASPPALPDTTPSADHEPTEPTDGGPPCDPRNATYLLTVDRVTGCHPQAAYSEHVPFGDAGTPVALAAWCTRTYETTPDNCTTTVTITCLDPDAGSTAAVTREVVAWTVHGELGQGTGVQTIFSPDGGTCVTSFAITLEQAD